MSLRGAERRSNLRRCHTFLCGLVARNDKKDGWLARSDKKHKTSPNLLLEKRFFKKVEVNYFFLVYKLFCFFENEGDYKGLKKVSRKPKVLPRVYVEVMRKFATCVNR